MQSSGNNFVIIDNINQNFIISKKDIILLSNSNYGIGFDQIILLNPIYKNNFDFSYRIYNSDGNEVNQCGNGAICTSDFVIKKKLTNKKIIKFKTLDSFLKTEFIKKSFFKVNMGIPYFKNESNCIKNLKLSLRKNKNFINFYFVLVKNPHIIIIVRKVENKIFKKYSKIISLSCSCFLEVNVTFAQILNKKKIYLKTYERGVGETKSCGSAACAAVFSCIKNKLLTNIIIHAVFPGGTSLVRYNVKDKNIYLIGKSNHVFEGYIKI